MIEPQQEPKSPNLGSDPSFYIDLVSSCSEPLPGSRTIVVSKPDGESAVRVLRHNSMHSPPRNQPYPPRLPSRCPIFPKSSDASTITSLPLFSEFLLPQVLAHEQTKVGQVTERNGQRGVRMPWPRRGGTRGWLKWCSFTTLHKSPPLNLELLGLVESPGHWTSCLLIPDQGMAGWPLQAPHLWPDPSTGSPSPGKENRMSWKWQSPKLLGWKQSHWKPQGEGMGQEADCIALDNNTSQQLESILQHSLGCGFLKLTNLYCSQEQPTFLQAAHVPSCVWAA